MAVPTELDLVVGAHFRAPITGAAAQGYGWTVTVAGTPSAVSVTIESVPADSPGVGSYPLELHIAAVSPGTATIGLTLARGSGRVRQRHEITVRVR